MFYVLGEDPKQHTNVWSMKVIGDVAPKARLDTELRSPRKKRDKSSEWSTIAGLIAQATQLQSLTFSCPEAMPLVLLQSIHNNHPAIRLNIASWTRLSPGTLHTDPAELALLGLPSLRSLQAAIHNPERNAQDLRLAAFWRLWRSAPNLQSLMLNITYGGCVMRLDNAAAIQEWKALASKFENTNLSHGGLPSRIKNLRITGGYLSQIKDSELSHLTTLDCSKLDLPLQTIHSLTSLTHLTLRNNKLTGFMSVDDCLSAFLPLTSLRVVRWRNCLQLDTILTHHGKSLRALAIHEFESPDSANPRGVLHISELLRIRDGLPHLEELSIDLNIPENPLAESDYLSTYTHREVYTALSTFLSLRRLQLNFNLGIATYENSSNRTQQPAGRRRLVPLVDEIFLKSVWAAVNFGRTASSTIRELRIAQGEADRDTGRGFPVIWAIWEQHTHHWLKATVSERDDEPNKLIISKRKDMPDFADDVWRECRW